METDPYINLLTTIIEQAVEDVKLYNTKKAKEWLLSEECQYLCDLLDIRHEIIVKWLEDNYGFANCNYQKPNHQDDEYIGFYRGKHEN